MYEIKRWLNIKEEVYNELFIETRHIFIPEVMTSHNNYGMSSLIKCQLP